MGAEVSQPPQFAVPAAPATTDRGKLGGLAGVVIAALVISAAVAAWTLVVDLGRASYVAGVLDRGADFTLAEATRQDHRVQGAATATLLTFLVTAAVFVTWFARVVRKLHASRPGEFRYGPGWAIGGWFIPFFNLVQPKLMLNDAWRAAVDRRERVPLVFHLWWAAYLLGQFTAAVGRTVGNDSKNDPNMLVTGDRIAAVGAAILIVAAFLGIAVVSRLDAAARQAGPPPNPVGPWGQLDTWGQPSTWGQPTAAQSTGAQSTGAQPGASPPPPVPAPAAAAPPGMVFNPPPGWPAPPPGWVPPPGWQPHPAWPAAPADWQLWIPANPA
jgi:hypothetical protein